MTGNGGNRLEDAFRKWLQKIPSEPVSIICRSHDLGTITGNLYESALLSDDHEDSGIGFIN